MIAAGAELLMVSDTHAVETAALPRHHDDPLRPHADRTGARGKLARVSADKAWRDYELNLANF